MNKSVEDPANLNKKDASICPKSSKHLNITYIHGLNSSGQSGTADRLRRYLPDDAIFLPDLPVEPFKALDMLRKLIEHEKTDLVIGTSMGGVFAQKLRGVPKILVNPSFHVSRSMRQKLGITEFFSPRADGIMHYRITETLCDRYEELERTQFDNLTAEERDLTLGMFGTQDDVVNCKDEFVRHYSHCA